MRRVVLLILVLNLLVAAAKGAYAAWSGSLAVATDAIHSLLDASSNIVGMVALRMAHSPPDAEHPYGHHKVEILAAAGIGVLIGGATFQFASSAVMALAAPEAASSSALKQMRLCMGTPSGWVYDRNSTNRVRAREAGTSPAKAYARRIRPQMGQKSCPRTGMRRRSCAGRAVRFHRR